MPAQATTNINYVRIQHYESAIQTMPRVLRGGFNDPKLQRSRPSVIDVTPVLEHLAMFGDNQPASTLDYARKLCWPISMCSFLRFGNVRGIGASKTTITGTHIAQREVKQHQMKAVHIIPHVVPGLCPICAYNAYRVQICARDKKIEFHKDPSVEVLPLVRHCSIPSNPIGNDRIGNHIGTKLFTWLLQ
ncbi:hypothetical protein BGZ79_009783 [Entomortierella chlamydospora]|nr:hypothetical protein BGZ79_009783 [Entomortierella chlamydospora]